jgi:acyl-CoA synthetase (AMP-forming)/AMP-acid ligase II
VSAALESLAGANVGRYGARSALSHGDRTWTYSQLAGATAALARRLRKAGVAPGDRVAIVAPNVPALVIGMLACWREGAVAVPLSARLREYDLGRTLADAAPSLIVSVEEHLGFSFSDLLPRLLTDLPTARGALLVDAGGAVIGELPAPSSAGTGRLAEDIALLLYTSGTTGAPKGALVRHGAMIAGAAAMAEVLEAAPEDRCVLVAPASHAFGLGCLLAGLTSGGEVVLVDATTSLQPTLAAIHHHNANVLHGSPALFISLIKAGPDLTPRPPSLGGKGVPRSGPVAPTEAREGPSASEVGTPFPRREGGRGVRSDFGALRKGFVAGASCPPEVLERLDAGGLRLLNLYGMTELGAISAARAGDPPSVRYQTSGRPLAGYEVRIASEEALGPVQVRGPHATPGYFGQPAQTAAAFACEWFRTGDLGSLDDGGNLRISGREKEVVLVGGLSVFPAEVEGFLVTHPDVVQAAVIGVPHPTMGEALQAYLVPRPGSGLTPQAVLQFGRQRVAGYKLPYAIQLVPELPLLPSGKPDRVALRAESLKAAQGSRPAPLGWRALAGSGDKP